MDKDTETHVEKVEEWKRFILKIMAWRKRKQGRG